MKPFAFAKAHNFRALRKKWSQNDFEKFYIPLAKQAVR